MSITRRSRLSVIHSHPIQYSAPLYRYLAQDPAIDLTVYYCSNKGVAPYYDKGFSIDVKWDIDLLGGYKHVTLPRLGKIERRGGFFSYTNPSIVSFLAKQKSDAVLINGRSYFTYVLGAIAAKLLGMCVLLREVVTSPQIDSRRKNLVRILALKPLYSLYDTIFYVGTNSKDYYRRLGIREEKLAFLPYAVDITQFRETIDNHRSQILQLRKSVNASCDNPIILYVGKLLRGKRVFDLIKAVECLQKQGLMTTLFLVGDGSQAGELHSYVRDHNISNVHFHGFVNQSLLPVYYGASDIFVFTTARDTWGAVINEAMAAGLPIITTNQAGAAKDLVIHGQNGFLYEAGDIDSLAKYIEILISDRDLMKSMSRVSSQMINSWSYQANVENIKKVLRI